MAKVKTMPKDLWTFHMEEFHKQPTEVFHYLNATNRPKKTKTRGDVV